MIVYRVHEYLFMLPAPFCSTLLFTARKKIWQSIYNERETNCGETVVKCFFFPFCLSFFLPFFCCSFSTCISENCPQWWAINKTKKRKIQSHQRALHSLRERFLGWNGELSSKQLDEHRGRRRKKEVNKVHEGVKVQKSSRRQRMAAQLAVRKRSPHRRVE